MVRLNLLRLARAAVLVTSLHGADGSIAITDVNALGIPVFNVLSPHGKNANTLHQEYFSITVLLG